MPRFLIFSVALILSAGCSKDNTGTEQLPEETAGQLLVKIEKKTTLSSGVVLSEATKFEYDDNRRLIAEGGRKYDRDERGRIYRITLSENPSNRREIDVYYSDPVSDKVSYTICRFVGIPYQFYDSIVYEHNARGALVGLVKYISQDGGPINRYQADEIAYSDKGNIERVKNYTINAAAILICGDFHFSEYDNKINPIHTTDEVRILENGWGLSNISFENILVINNSTYITYQYRNDGRPRSAIVRQNGQVIAELKYYYE